jgi:hypothetical protein
MNIPKRDSRHESSLGFGSALTCVAAGCICADAISAVDVFILGCRVCVQAATAAIRRITGKKAFDFVANTLNMNIGVVCYDFTD